MPKELWHDFKNIADMAAKLAEGKTHIPGAELPVKPAKSKIHWRLPGTILGPKGNEIEYEFSCFKRQRLGAFGPGTCSVIEIERSGPGAVGLHQKTSVGNLYGFTTQLARDASRAWGIKPSPKESGFEGVRRKRAQRRR